MKSVEFISLRFTLFFSWFISFAILNFPSMGWGLQTSWFFGLIFIISRLINILYTELKIRSNPSFNSVLLVLFLIVSFTTVAVIARVLELTKTSIDVDPFRTIFHTVYILFYVLLCILLFDMLSKRNVPESFMVNWFIINPFLFISVWGAYQFVATYEFIPYYRIFNNNVSTGFTWDRFYFDHRVASVFAEPSEYSYYLAAVAPFIYAACRRKLPRGPGNFHSRVLANLWISQALVVKSLTFVVALPFIFYFCAVYIEKVRVRTLILISPFLIVLMLPIFVISGMSARVLSAATGADLSTLERIGGFVQALSLFHDSPVFGFGYGVIRGLDLISFALASFGAVGSFFLVLGMYKYLSSLSINRSGTWIAGFICLFAASITSNNVLGHLFFWLMATLICATHSKNRASTSF